MNATNECKYRPGQVWDYKTRPSEPRSTLTILKVSTMPLGETIVHIAIEDLHLTELNGEVITNGNGEEIGHTISHTPVSPEVLDRSVTKPVNESGPIPDFAEGYADWKKESGCAFNADGYMVAKVVTLLENAFRHGTDVEPTQ
jgi:hypothetical protein